MKTSTLRPGLLVSLKTSVVGNVRYNKKVLEDDHKIEDGALAARWETERLIMDPEEHEAGKKARSKARAMITGVCSYSAFGLLCPENAAFELENAIAQARAVADEFNANAKLSRINFYIMTGRIAPDDVEAVRAINSEVRDLLADMETGVRNLNVKTIREAANKAKSIGQMLSPDAAARIQMAIDAARKTAREIVQAGEQAAVEVDRRTLRMLDEARTAFLDIGPGADVASPDAEARCMDMDPGASLVEPPTEPASLPIDMEPTPEVKAIAAAPPAVIDLN